MGTNTRQLRKDKQVEFVRSQFIEAAWEIIVKDGVRAVTVDEVARRAGYAPGSVYNYFSGKDDLLIRAFQFDARKSLEALALDIPEGPDLEQRLTVWLAGVLKRSEEKRSLLLDLEQSLPLSSGAYRMEMRQLVLAHLSELVKLLAERLAQVLPEGSAAPEDAAWVLLAMVKEQFFRWIIQEPGGPGLSEQAPVIIRFTLHGVLGGPAKATGSAKAGGQS